jgi:hypothetical protein
VVVASVMGIVVAAAAAAVADEGDIVESNESVEGS